MAETQRQAEVAEAQRQAQAAAQQAARQAEVQRLQEVASQAAELAGAQRPEESVHGASTEEDRVIEFGEQLAAQWTIRAQEQQQELVQKVLAAQAESAERHRGEVAGARRELDQELGRMGSVGESIRIQVGGLG